MKVAVTGATGFCGGAVVRLLLTRGHDVVTVGRRPADGVSQWRRWDAASELPDLRGVDAVIHLAATVGDIRPGAGADDFNRVNVGGAQRLLDAATDTTVVWVSSSSVYDPGVDRTHVHEAHPTSGGHLNDYGRTKAIGDRLAIASGAVVLRPRAVYGPGDVHLLPRLIRAVRGGRLLLPGPDIDVSITHVDNLASACVAGLSWGEGAYNIADADPVRRDATLVAVLSAALRRPITVSHVPLRVADAAAVGVCAMAHAWRRNPLLSRYVVDTVGRTFVLDTTRAVATGWRPDELMPDYLDHLRTAG